MDYDNISIDEARDWEFVQEYKYWCKRYFHKWDNLESGNSYVYFARDGDKIVYVGSGAKDRWKHVTSGASHNKELNRMHFEGKDIRTVIFKDDISKCAAIKLEKFLIRLLVPHANENDKPSDSFIRNYGSWWNAHSEGKMKEDVFIKLLNTLNQDDYF